MITEHAWLLAAIPAGFFLVLALFGRYLPAAGRLPRRPLDRHVFRALLLRASRTSSQYRGGLGPWVNDIEWSTVGDLDLRMGIYIDPITIVMFGVVTIVALMVNIFSIGYMKGEPRYYWFFAVLQLFVASMLMLVMADNLLLLYAAWELVGVCSFLLIGFYWEKRSAVEAAKKAFITTRIGDVGLLIGIILLWQGHRHLQHPGDHPRGRRGRHRRRLPLHRLLFLFLGCMGKSAQVPVPRLAAGRDGRPDAGLRPHPRRHDGRGRRLPHRAHAPGLRSRRWHAAHHHDRRPDDRAADRLHGASLRRTSRRCSPTRPSASSASCSSRLASGEPAVGDVPPDDARLLQGAPLPRLWLRHPRARTTTRRWTSSAASGRRCRSPARRSSSARWRSPALPIFAGFWSKDEILVALSHSWGGAGR